ncbi:MAG: metal-sensing transcriptional repressor, partial [Clostridia bacterium]|nr:metal-sensing transcriptional repressor [Clostridia bacterium]
FRLLKTARGQIDGIIRMAEENRYCIDISTQLLACQALLGTINKEVLKAHLSSCVMNAQEDKEEKLREIASVLDKLL